MLLNSEIVRPIRIGLVSSPPFLFPTEHSTLDGILAPYLYNLYYFILDKTNVTFHSMAVSPVDICSDQGTCSGGLSYIQSGETDFIGIVGLDSLKSIGPNLTVLPVVWERNCHFSYTSNLKTSTSNSSFFDFIFSFNLTFWALFVALFGIFILTNSFFLKYYQNLSYINIFWSQFDYFLSQYFIASEQIERKFFFLIFIIAYLMASKLLSASLKTGMMQQSDHLKLESFTDVINHDFTPCFWLPSNCGKLFNDSTDLNTRRSMERAIVNNLAGQSFGDIFEMLNQNRYVTIIDDPVYTSVKTYECLYANEEQGKKSLILSEIPAYKHILGIVLNKFNLKSEANVIVKGSHSVTEFGLFEHDRVKKLAVKSLAGSETPSSCLHGNKREHQVVNAPITFTYLFVPFIMQFVGIISGLLAHIFCNHY